MHASQIQGCIVEHRVEKKWKITETVWVHNAVTVWTGKVAGQCAMPYMPRWPVLNVLAIQWVASGGFGVMQWRRVERCMDADRQRLYQSILDALKAIYMLRSCAVQDGIHLIEKR